MQSGMFTWCLHATRGLMHKKISSAPTGVQGGGAMIVIEFLKRFINGEIHGSKDMIS